MLAGLIIENLMPATSGMDLGLSPNPEGKKALYGEQRLIIKQASCQDNVPKAAKNKKNTHSRGTPFQ